MSHLDAVLERIDRDLDSSLDRLFTLLRIQSVSTDPAYKDSCRAAAEHVAADLKSIGFATEVRPTDGHPIVIGKSGDGKAKGKSPRVLFYGHYDVQPVDPLDQWTHPPFEPRIETLPDGRKIIVARGACDDKGQAMTFIEACRAYKTVTGSLPLSITMMIEGEEECGSKHLFGFVRDHADEFKLDLALVCDTSMWDQKTPAITTSLRGLVYEEVRLTCADRDLHSGLFGGAAQNPLRVLSRILAAMHDDQGRVTIPGFYDGVKELPPEIKADLKGLNLTPETFLGQVGLKVPAGEKDRMLIEQIATRPTAEINGIIGGYTGDTLGAVQQTAEINGAQSLLLANGMRTNFQGDGISANLYMNSCSDPTATTSTLRQDRSRMMSPGRLFTMPPSTSMLPSSSTGTNTPGSDALARIALHKDPRS
jgi:acetylornithine deacetylase/succinyl-diaminopimelate desuccinylase-like protein